MAGVTAGESLDSSEDDSYSYFSDIFGSNEDDDFAGDEFGLFNPDEFEDD